MAHWKTLFAYEHLGCHDLPQDETTKAYIDIVVEIKSIEKKEITGEKGRKDICPVAVLKGASKPMILNKTNLGTLAELFETTEYLEYIGKPFILYAARVKGKEGGIVDGLRIRSNKPTIAEKPKPELNPQHPKWASAKKAIKEGNTTIDAIKGTYNLTAENEALIKS